MHEHILIIGGSGMLASASVSLAKRCKSLTSIARTTNSQSALDKRVSAVNPNHFLVQLDWNSSEFLGAISEHVKKQGCPSLVVAWFHNDDLGSDLAHALSQQCTIEIDMFQALGSSAADPSKAAGSTPHSLPDNIRHHRIVLGFKIENETSRWLTHSEICAGVISAIDQKSRTTIVGTVSPWSARP